MNLYHTPGACSLSDLIVLEWIGAPHEMVKMSALNGCFLPVVIRRSHERRCWCARRTVAEEKLPLDADVRAYNLVDRNLNSTQGNKS